MDHTTQERTRCQDHCTGAQFGPVPQNDPRNAVAIHDQIGRLTLHHIQVRGGGDKGLHRFAIDFAVGLRARALDRRPLAPVQQTKLDARSVGDLTHQAIHRINLTHQMALAQTTDGGVTGHDANPVAAQRDQSGPRPHTRSRMCGVGTRVPAPDNDHIKVQMFHVKHSSLPKAEA